MIEINKVRVNLKVGDSLKRLSDNQWYAIDEYIIAGNGSQDKAAKNITVVFPGFVVPHTSLHKHFYCDINRQFIVRESV